MFDLANRQVVKGNDIGIGRSNHYKNPIESFLVTTRYSLRARDKRRDVSIDIHYPVCQPKPRKALASILRLPCQALDWLGFLLLVVFTGLLQESAIVITGSLGKVTF
ncbi:Uncharacterized protein TCM_003114 [Theobroma cacao]|uniref:Uncharacterized protein n=1 Tax=Theobroma cacao TaxID=3641 RepID=A0A061DMU9_THECC|nr:Uncharacterized protein TCM_003114 [Theobroma cacao]